MFCLPRTKEVGPRKKTVKKNEQEKKGEGWGCVKCAPTMGKKGQ